MVLVWLDGDVNLIVIELEVRVWNLLVVVLGWLVLFDLGCVIVDELCWILV